ncbi:hypothetical protein SK128_023564, partial [Halocaridina rubra]
ACGDWKSATTPSRTSQKRHFQVLRGPSGSLTFSITSWPVSHGTPCVDCASLPFLILQVNTS